LEYINYNIKQVISQTLMAVFHLFNATLFGTNVLLI